MEILTAMCAAVLRISVALVVWQSTMDCICILYLPPGDQTDQDTTLPNAVNASCVVDENSDRAHLI
jgi:hypothetical protein